ncbi:LacI family transcriptional regulator [Frondihabitans sp. PhB161]|nr:LacI family transcriptional regulator [Frondihabitans sp. PhB153]RPF02650.1 LacI family transcriptional regulator [Frondihabitans sp. PhB161]
MQPVSGRCKHSAALACNNMPARVDPVNNRVTIVDVAARAGVAISSVSSALNDRPGVSEATRKRIVEAAHELGFVPSLRGRSLSSKRAFSVGLVVHRDPSVLESDPFFGSFIGGIETVLDAQNYALILQMGSEKIETLERYRSLAANRRVDGVFLSELGVEDPRIPLVKELGLPAVGVNAEPDFPLPAVRQSHVEGIRELVDHLVSHGHRRLALVTGPTEFIHAGQRLRAWSEAVAAHGLAPGQVVEGDFTYEGGVAAASRLLTDCAPDERPTAVMCSNDLSAIGFLARADELGVRAPDDISVAGFDGIALGSYIRPSLSTIATTPRLLGVEAARMLLAAIAGERVDDVDIAPAQLLPRGSTGPAPAHS